MSALSRTGRKGLIAIAKRMLELAERPPREYTQRDRVEAMSDHMNALYRYARNGEAIEFPSREHAMAIHESYYLLLDENRRLRVEVGAERMYERMSTMMESCPALERWRTLVLDSPHQPAISRAAAWELTSLREELEGHALDAEFARLYAEEAIVTAPSAGEVAA